jgi:hypothetical protein
MEKQIMDILNIGIGLLQAGKEGLERAKTELEKSYTELSTRGAQDNSEGAVQIRHSLDKNHSRYKRIHKRKQEKTTKTRALKSLITTTKSQKKFKIKCQRAK